MNKTKLLLKITFFFFFSVSAAVAQQWGDYTLYSEMATSNAYLIDTNNVVYHSWALSSNAKTGYSSYLLPGGTLLRTVSRSGNSFTGGPICGQVQKVDWNGTIIWDYVYSTTAYCSHHDIYPMPNGNVLLIAYERKSAAEVAAAGCNTFTNEMWPDKIVEVQPTGATTGTVVWEWRAWDHLVQNVNSSLANYQSSIVDHPELLNINFQARKDWMHMNGLSYNPMLDQVAFSCHNLNEIYVIDHSTTTAEAASHSGGNSGKGGDILYRWGNPAAYGATGSAVLNIVHDAHWIPEGSPNAGDLVAFNNRGVSMTQSAVDQIIPPVNGYTYTITPGSAYAPASYTRRHACNGGTSNMGSSQQLPNGNQLVCIALQHYIYEVDSAGTLLWSKTTTANVAKAWRYSACYVNNEAPPLPVISESAGYLVTDSATTYQWYIDGELIPGQNNRTVNPVIHGNYVVRVTDSAGCVYSYSTSYRFPSVTSVKNTGDISKINIFPNPSTGIIHIDNAASGKDFVVMVYDLLGKTLLHEKNRTTIDLSGFREGIYMITVMSETNEVLRSKITLIR